MVVLVFSHSVMSDSVAPWTAARQAALSSTISWSLLKLMSIESVMPPNHLILCSTPFSFCLQSFPAPGSFPVSQSSELPLQQQSFQWIFRVDFFHNWLVSSLTFTIDCYHYCTVLLYFPRYCTIRLKVFFIFCLFLFIIYVKNIISLLLLLLLSRFSRVRPCATP